MKNALLPASLLLTGCSLFKDAETIDVHTSPTFSASSIAAEGLVIGAAVSSNPERLARESSPTDLANALQQEFLEERPQTKVLPPGSVELALGPEKYKEFRAYFEKSGDVELDCVPAIREKLHDATRYLLMARITNDEISTNESTNQQFRDNKWLTTSIDYKTTRETTMLFAVYDLRSSSLEWKGHLKTASYKTRTVGTSGYEESRAGDSLFDFLTQVLLEDCEPSGPPYPAPASIQDQTSKIYGEFLVTLFGEKK